MEQPVQSSDESLHLPDPIARALARFAWISRKILLWRAAGWVVVALTIAFTLIALADRFLLLREGIRQVLAVSAYLGIAALGSWLCYCALRQWQILQTALELEACAPHGILQERISTTVELAGRNVSSEGLSQAMIQQVAHEASEYIQILDVDQLPDRTGARRIWMATGAILTVGLILCLIQDLQMPLLYCRAFVPWINLNRASNTGIHVLTGNTRVVDGDTLEIDARITGENVDESFVEIREKKGGWQQLRMDTDPGLETRTSQRFFLKIGPLHTALEYRITAGDGQSQNYNVEVLPRPEVIGLKLTIHYPKYTGLPPQSVERFHGDLAVLKGSQIELSLNANTTLDAAMLEFTDDRRLSMSVTRETASVTFDVTQDISYRVKLRSSEGVSNPEAPLFVINAVPDLPPTVTVIRPKTDEAVSINSVLPLEVRASDDLGVVSMRLVCQCEQRQEPIVLPLDRPAEAGKVWMLSQPWDLGGFFLESGSAISFHIEALDAAGSIGRCEEQRLHISSGQKRQDRLLLAQLDGIQKNIFSARQMLTGVEKDVAQMRELSQPQNFNIHATEQLLITASLQRVAFEVRTAATALEKCVPTAESGTLQTLFASLQRSFAIFSEADLRPLLRCASHARSSDVQAVAELEVLTMLLPDIEKKLLDLHSALTAGHRYASARFIGTRAADICERQSRVSTILLGTAGWTPGGAVFPGLESDYYQGKNFEVLVRRSVELRLDIDQDFLKRMDLKPGSLRWQGQFLAPKAGRYVFRPQASGNMNARGNVNLTIAGKRLDSQWKEKKYSTVEAGIDLVAGWNEIIVEFQPDIRWVIFKLWRSGPDLEMSSIPTEHLRHTSTPILGPVLEVQKAMAHPASKAAVVKALASLKSSIEIASSFPTALEQLASLEPRPVAEFQKEAAAWKLEMELKSSGLAELTLVTSGVAIPLMQWREHMDMFVEKSKKIEQFCLKDALIWMSKLSTHNYDFSLKLQSMEIHVTTALQKGFKRLLIDVALPDEMVKDDALVRVFVEDLPVESAEIAKDLRNASRDIQRSINERRCFEALAYQAGLISNVLVASLESMLARAASPEQLARSANNKENFGTAAENFIRKTQALRQSTEKVERILALRDAMNRAMIDFTAARFMLERTPSAETAAAQQRTASALKACGYELNEASKNVKHCVSQRTMSRIEQVIANQVGNDAVDYLGKLADQTLAGEKHESPATDNDDPDEDRKIAVGLETQVRATCAVALALEDELAILAGNLNGDAVAVLKGAANHAQDSVAALAGLPDIIESIVANEMGVGESPLRPGDSPTPMSNNGLNNLERKLAIESAREQLVVSSEVAAHTADRLALDAEALHQQGTKPGQREYADDFSQHADEFSRIAAALHHEVREMLDPLVDSLDHFQDNQNSETDLPLDASDRAMEVAKNMNHLADITARVVSNDPVKRKQAHDWIADWLKSKDLAENVNNALKQADALDKVASQLTEKGDASLKFVVKELAEKLGLDPDENQTARLAMDDRVNQLTKELREKSKHKKQVAKHLEDAVALEKQARNNLVQKGLPLALVMHDLSQKAEALAKANESQPVAAPLKDAGNELEKAGKAIQDITKKADTAGLKELAEELNNTAKSLEKSNGELADVSSGSVESSSFPLDTLDLIGRQLRDTAGCDKDLANEIQAADRAAKLAVAGSQTSAVDSEKLEQEVHSLIVALDNQEELPPGMKAELAALAKSMETQNIEQKRAMMNSVKHGQSGLKAAAAQAHFDADRMANTAAQLEQLSQLLRLAGLPVADANQSPAEAALAALLKAQIASETCSSNLAQTLNLAAYKVNKAAESAREQAAGSAQDQGERHSKWQNPDLGDMAERGKSHGGAKNIHLSGGRGGKMPMPANFPIDNATWNRLPDSLRRDIQNAVGGRFPSEYEESIKRYFENLATVKND